MNKTNVIEINKDILLKTFVNEKGLNNELSGLTYLSGVKTNIPVILGVGKNKIVSSYIDNTVTSYEAIQKKLVSKNDVNSFVLNYLKSLKDTNNQKVWESFINSTCKNFFANTSIFKKYLGSELYRLTAGNIRYLRNNPNSKNEPFRSKDRGLFFSLQKKSIHLQPESIEFSAAENKIIFLHGDLHLGNILYDTRLKEFWLIDFEHSKFGPVEYEFANSKFWNDEKSLDIEYFSNNIPGFKIFALNSYLYLYLADQLNIASENKDIAKIKQLSYKAASHNTV
ncbi:protein containing Aminoglycoside phosphotransferase domain [sediment metagenome]|uniref:Protein containing Aminoglycoside phosphotransferase domain n=1 Tax=sediment metagenome TaxID=749907 RepID=D9PHL0_9ZZZZ